MSETFTSQIGRVCVGVEIGGKVHFVNLPQDRLRMLVSMAAGLSDDGKVPVIEAPEGFRFAILGEEQP